MDLNMYEVVNMYVVVEIDENDNITGLAKDGLSKVRAFTSLSSAKSSANRLTTSFYKCKVAKISSLTLVD